MTAICSKCGRDCRTPMALGKHEGKCGGPITEDQVSELRGMLRNNFMVGTIPIPKTYYFHDRHDNKEEKCPRCCEIWADFLVMSVDTWVCLGCGCHFMPKAKLDEVRAWKDKNYRRTVNA